MEKLKNGAHLILLCVSLENVKLSEIIINGLNNTLHLLGQEANPNLFIVLTKIDNIKEEI